MGKMRIYLVPSSSVKCFSILVNILLFKVAKSDHYCLNLFIRDDGNWIIILILFNEDKGVNA